MEALFGHYYLAGKNGEKWGHYYIAEEILPCS